MLNLLLLICFNLRVKICNWNYVISISLTNQELTFDSKRKGIVKILLTKLVKAENLYVNKISPSIKNICGLSLSNEVRH